MIKRKIGEDKDDQEGGPTFMVTTAAAVWEVCMVVSTSKVRTKYTVSSTIHGKIKTTTNDDDVDENDGGGVDRGASAGWGTTRTHS